MTSNGTWDIGSYEDLRRRAQAAEAKLSEVRSVIDGFFAHYANSSAPFLDKARDLAEGIRQVLDRDKISDEGEAQ